MSLSRPQDYGGPQASFGNSHGQPQQPQSFHNNQQQFSYQKRNQPFSKAKQPKQPPAEQSLSNEPIVLGDYMGMASVSIEGNNPLFCHICHVKLNSKEQAEFHYRGIRHIKKARVARMAEGESDTHKTIGFERLTTHSHG